MEDNSLMVNATQMAKQFNKRPVDWLRLPSTISFIEELSSVRKSHTSEFQAVITKVGSPENGGGTWFHEDLALEYARWLSPGYSIWTNDRTVYIPSEEGWEVHGTQTDSPGIKSKIRF